MPPGGGGFSGFTCQRADAGRQQVPRAVAAVVDAEASQRARARGQGRCHGGARHDRRLRGTGEGVRVKRGGGPPDGVGVGGSVGWVRGGRGRQAGRGVLLCVSLDAAGKVKVIKCWGHGSDGYAPTHSHMHMHTRARARRRTQESTPRAQACMHAHTDGAGCARHRRTPLDTFVLVCMIPPSTASSSERPLGLTARAVEMPRLDPGLKPYLQEGVAEKELLQFRKQQQGGLGGRAARRLRPAPRCTGHSGRVCFCLPPCCRRS